MDTEAALDASAEILTQGFAEVAGQLSVVRGGLQDLVTRLVDLDRVLNEQRGQGRVLDVVCGATIGFRDALGAAAEAAAPARVIAASTAAQEALAGIGRRTRMLDAVANLSLITARSLRLDGFDGYVRDLRALGDAMGQDAAQMAVAVAALRSRRERAGALYARAAGSLGEVVAALDDHTRTRAETAHLLAVTIDGVAAVTARLPGVLATETGALVQAIQFADEAAQRVDHARMILSQGSAAEAALAGAQLDALVTATRERVAGVRASLARIEAGATEAGRALSSEAGPEAGPDAGPMSGPGSTPAARAVDLGRSLLTALAGSSARALGAIDGASGESGALTDLSAEADRRFASVVRATEAIHLMAINAALLSRSENGQERAMSVLSVDVQELAAACARASEGCRGAMAELTRAEDLGSFVAVSGTAETFRRAMGETSAAIEAAGLALKDLDRLRAAAADSLRALDAGVAAARRSVGAIEASAGELSRVAAGLPRTLPPGSGTLDHLLDLYTMEAERAVHRRLVGLPEPRSDGPVASGGVRSAGASPDDGPRDTSSAATEEDLLAAVLF